MMIPLTIAIVAFMLAGGLFIWLLRYIKRTDEHKTVLARLDRMTKEDPP